MLDFNFKNRHKDKKDIALMKNNNGYWNDRYCYISESRWDVQYLEKCASHSLA